ncbi:Inner membrane protein CreD [Andreprevotia sp. IGB-42]|uniref:cell envelope integrity protein CreD n=1 Tax=Andreprevotia sp. IGB-42 TaxID=2497473 RepID=UPI00135CB2CA|nr:cell envelope integrity protein CreD [Andreprevotia sp. IGB-42]KAF0814876.1 Inner membrane protein CreD [Andreprevotia sp. IGB-42]
MKKTVGYKLLAIGFLVLVLMIVMSLVRSLVNERQHRAQEVVAEIAEHSARAQTLTGPFLIAPYIQTEWTLTERKERGEVIKEWQAGGETVHRIIVQPDMLDVNGNVAVTMLKRGIFQAPIYKSGLKLAGRFTLPARGSVEQRGESQGKRYEYRWGQPYLAVGVSDARGLGTIAGSIGGVALKFLPGSTQSWLGAGVHAPLNTTTTEDVQQFDFAFNVALSGTETLNVTPIGKANKLALSGDWAHPSFVGPFAPAERTTAAKGFSASWQANDWATGLTEEKLARCADADKECEQLGVGSFGLRLIDPVDRYVLVERTVKYAELFLLLTFGAFFLMEVLKRLIVHPVQYGLVGLALALFFLLTLSLSEHMSFASAYWIAAASSIALLGYYISHVLAGWRRGLGFSGLLAVLYAVLFGILQSEDMALLMGSLVLFGLLAVVMVLTRKVNWYGIGNDATADKVPPLPGAV